MVSSEIEFLFVLCLALLCSSCLAVGVTYDSRALVINGERRIIFSGAIHYPRSTPEMWPDLIQKAKHGGLDAIETYIFWDRHEPFRRKYDFTGNLDFIKFFKLIQKEGLSVIVRIGPYVCAEWNYGGFPLWLHKMPGVELRTNNQIYKNEMQIFTTKIVNMCKQEKLFASQGGPIILAQIENEYGNIMSSFGDAGKAYIQWCAQMAVAQNIGVPWIMCQQADAPKPMINTCNGYYCHDFQPSNPNSPKIFTENWLGWFKKWGERDPHRSAEDTAYSVARFFQNGGILNNYYMYHGGTNFGRTSGGPYITTTYDYDAPLDEFGNLNQPKWGHLKQLHEAIKLGEKILTNSTRDDKELGNSVTLTTYKNNVTGERFCFLSNVDQSKDANIDLQQDGKYFVPAWSVTVLNDCNNEVYNTAKIKSQTSIMIKKKDERGASDQLSWKWLPEAIKDTLKGRGKFQANQLLEQKSVTSDSSDYLWYMTGVHINDTSAWSNAILDLNTTGHVLHAFINRKFIGSQWGLVGEGFRFEKNVTLKHGTNIITLLSATVGLPNYGAKYDLIPQGIAGGPVQLIGNNITTDLSSNPWSYKVGLNGETKRMGKGQAWVNGKSIGRYWPSFLANKDGCSDTCDYRGPYKPEKCNTNCGNSSQRWYHVPRSFFNNDSNTLILFEEIGGNPENVSVQTVTTVTICGQATEGSTLELSCQGGRTISAIQFASFGDPQGNCGSFKKGSWEALNSFSAVEAVCIGKESCGLSVTKETFGLKNNGNINRRLAVQATC
ncbi:Beta-galactosidase [Quillaja saponaria]|uniref:Beta-galactosidase n=1 Tax=Quillaja saponaria TaxID=32244 RepID=A0AAD7L2Q0_QUISA|nr:Beta-galactosidase [Quillaja saponaria]